MPTPQELARTAEQLDEAQWFDFLDELDAVHRRRRQRAQTADEPRTNHRDDVAAWVARKHLSVDSSIQKVVYLPHAAPQDEIRLLEVNDRLALSQEEEDRIRPVDFGLNLDGAGFRLLVADISSSQFDAARTGRIALPAGWHMQGAITNGRRP